MLGCWWWRLEASGLLLLLFSLLAESWGVTTLIFYILFCDTLEIFRKFFFLIYRFHQNFGRVSPILGGPKLSTYTLFTLLISHISS
jgi:hypothetical protein